MDDSRRFDPSVSVEGINMSGILEKFFRPQEINLKNPKACSNCGSVKVVLKDGMYVCKVCGFKTDAGRDPERIRQMKRKRLLTNIALFVIVAAVFLTVIWFGVSRNRNAEAGGAGRDELERLCRVHRGGPVCRAAYGDVHRPVRGKWELYDRPHASFRRWKGRSDRGKDISRLAL